MVWIPKCCESSNNNVDTLMRNQVSLFFKKIETKTQQGQQGNIYTPNLVLTKRCHIKDRSAAAQDTAINNGIRDAESSKEFIFKNFNVTTYKFNEIDWSGSRFQVLSTNKLSSVTLDGKRYTASDAKPFISIIAGLKKL